MTRIPKKAIKKWVEELRSGRWEQARGRLQSNGAFCCLGIACNIFMPPEDLKLQFGVLFGTVPADQENAPDWLRTINDRFFEKTGTSLSQHNDSGKTFPEIADLLEETYLK